MGGFLNFTRMKEYKKHREHTKRITILYTCSILFLLSTLFLIMFIFNPLGKLSEGKTSEKDYDHTKAQQKENISDQEEKDVNLEAIGDEESTKENEPLDHHTLNEFSSDHEKLKDENNHNKGETSNQKQELEGMCKLTFGFIILPILKAFNLCTLLGYRASLAGLPIFSRF